MVPSKILKKDLIEALAIQIKTNENLCEELESEKRRCAELLEKNEKIDTIEKNLKNHIISVSQNTMKQIEAYLGLQSYLLGNTLPLKFHGWPISPDIALFIIQKIEVANYDLIIEFGSGTSTVLIAKAIEKNDKKHKTEFVTFEHNQKFYDLTSQSLVSQSVEKYADLTYSPLEEYTYGEKEFLYYTCEKKLKALAEKKHSKVLVLVDGPPGATGPLARFPALPYLLKYFSEETIHLILDDYIRDEEKEISRMWEKILKEKNISFQSDSIPTEKGLYYCEIN